MDGKGRPGETFCSANFLHPILMYIWRDGTFFIPDQAESFHISNMYSCLVPHSQFKLRTLQLLPEFHRRCMDLRLFDCMHKCGNIWEHLFWLLIRSWISLLPTGSFSVSRTLILVIGRSKWTSASSGGKKVRRLVQLKPLCLTHIRHQFHTVSCWEVRENISRLLWYINAIHCRPSWLSIGNTSLMNTFPPPLHFWNLIPWQFALNLYFHRSSLLIPVWVKRARICISFREKEKSSQGKRESTASRMTTGTGTIIANKLIQEFICMDRE